MKKFIAVLMLIFFCCGCMTAPKINTFKEIEKQTLYKITFINETITTTFHASVGPVILTEENKKFFHKQIILYPQWFVEKHEEYGASKHSVHVAKEDYVVVFIGEDVITNEFLGWGYRYITVKGDGEFIFQDKRNLVEK